MQKANDMNTKRDNLIVSANYWKITSNVIRSLELNGFFGGLDILTQVAPRVCNLRM